MHRIGTFLAAKGRRLLGWDEILQGGLAPGATVMSWRGTEGGIAAARAGHRAVMAPTEYCYLDFCQDDPTREPVAAAAFLTLAQAYSYDPAPDSLGADVVPMILGVQGNLWCEHVPTAEHAEHMIWPRLLAIAEVGWSAPERKDYDDFHARVLDAVAWMQQRGYHPFDQKNAVGPRPESLEPLHCLSTGRPVVYHTSYSPKYAAAGDGSLTDGLRGGWNYGDHRWQGWLDTDVELVVDLGERLPVKRIAACFMQGFYADIWMPRAVEISVSDDDRHYTPLAAVENDIPFEYKQDCYREFGWSGQTAARYVPEQPPAGVIFCFSGGRPLEDTTRPFRRFAASLHRSGCTSPMLSGLGLLPAMCPTLRPFRPCPGLSLHPSCACPQAPLPSGYFSRKMLRCASSGLRRSSSRNSASSSTSAAMSRYWYCSLNSSKRIIDNSVCSISLMLFTISSRPIDCLVERT